MDNEYLDIIGLGIFKALNDKRYPILVNGKISESAIPTSITNSITSILSLIPDAASSENKLADKNFVNSSIATNTATFRGTFDDLATLQATSADINDYAFYVHTDEIGNTAYDRYKHNGSTWVFEYTLNNSSFTAEQWSAINSGITTTKVGNYDAHLINYSNPHKVTKSQVGLGLVENVAISTWKGSENITTLGTITKGTWKGTKIGNDYLANSSITIGTTAISLGSTAKSLAGIEKLQLNDANSNLVYDSTTGSWKLTGNLLVTGFISAGAKGTSGGGSSTYTQKEWAQIKEMTATVAGSLASAYAVKEAYNELNTAIETLAGKATNVKFTQTLTSGKQIGTISIDGKSTSLFAPANYAWSEVTGKPAFATVATSGSYSDLSNKPTIASLMGGAAIGGTSSFIYWNGSAFVSKALGTNAFTSISKVSQLTNDSGYISGITKSMVEAVLTGDITSHTHSQYLTSHQTVSLASGTNNGTLKLTVGSTTTDNIAVKGLGSAAYTNSSAYATASHTHSQYLTAHQTIYALTIQKNGTTAGTYTPNSQAATINISDVASAAALSGHTTNTTVHITANERTLWNKITGLFDVDTDGDVYVKNGKGFYTEGFISAGAKGTSGGSGSTYTQKEWAQIKEMTATAAGSLASAYAVKEAYSEAKTLIDVNTGNITSLTSRVTTLEGKATAVSFSQTLTSGTKIGAITVDGTTTNIYAPTLASQMGSTAIGGTSSYLYWNGSAWATKALGSNAFTSISKVSQLTNDSGYITGITKSMVEGVLTGNITSHTHSYLPLAGGTVTGQLRIKTVLDRSFILDESEGEKYHIISFRASGEEYAYLLADNKGSENKLVFNGFTILHSSNVGSYALKLDGSNAMTGGINWNNASVGANVDTFGEGLIVGRTTDSGTTLDGLGYKYASVLNVSNGVYRFQIASAAANANKLLYRGYDANAKTYFDWKTIAFIDSNVASSSKWANPRTITLTGSVTGSVSIDGSGDVSLATTTNHTHNYLPLSGGTLTGSLQIGASDNTAYNDMVLVRQGKYIRINCHGTEGNIDYGTYGSGGTKTSEQSLRFSLSGLSLVSNGTVSRTILHSGNYNSYSPKLDGTGATGTWGISISGNAATATNADTLAKTFAENINYAARTTGLKLIRYNDNWDTNGFPEKWTSGLSVMAGYCGWQLVTFGGSADTPYFRKVSDSGVWSNWRALAFTDSNVASASKWANARTITLTGSVTGSVSIDGSQNVSLATTTNHTHTFDSLTSKPTTISGYGITDAYTASTIDSKLSGYLPLSGGTINSGTFRPLVIDSSYNGITELGISNKTTIYSGFGYNNGYTFIGREDGGGYPKIGIRHSDNTPVYSPNNFTTIHTLLHSGNYNSYCPKLDGTGATGTWGISISGNAATATNADKLDGFHESDFSRHITGTTRTTGTKYFKLGNLPKSNDSTWDAFLIQGEIGGWGSLQKTVLNVCVGRRNGVAFCGYTQGLWNRNLGIDIGVNDAGEIVLIVTGQYCAWTLDLHTIQGTISYTGTTFTPTDTNFVLLSASNYVSKSLVDGTVEKATKLANSRTIWGQSFDGTGNVSGAPSFPSIIDINRNVDTGALIDSSKIGFEIETFANDVRLKTYQASGAGNPSHLVLTSNGNVGIGTTSPSYKLHIAGVAYASGGLVSDGYISAASTSTSSDIRLKDNISEISSEMALKWLSMLKPKSWTWNSLAGVKGQSMGFVAQDVEGILPQMIRKRRDNDYLSLDYTQLHALEVSALQSHEKRIEELERENKILKEELNKLKLYAN